MFDVKTCARALRVLRWGVVGLLLTLATAQAGPISFGQRSIYVPDPDGYVPLSKSLPRFMQVAQAYLPQTNRLVEAYATSPDAAAMEEGKSVALKRYFQIQTLRKTDGVPVSNEEFADAAGEIEKGLRQALGDAASIGKDLTDKGNKEVKRMTSVDPQVSLSETGYLGIYRKEAWGQFFTVKTKLSANVMDKSQDLVCAGVIALVNYQIVFLYGYANYKNEGDRQWVENAVSEWADQVHGANPDDAKVAAKIPKTHFDFKEVLRWGVIGGIIGLLAALVGKIFRKT
jgi:hypothetical protein